MSLNASGTAVETEPRTTGSILADLLVSAGRLDADKLRYAQRVHGKLGFGKTTTLYGAINYLNDPHTSIIAAEDSVEYVIDGVNQCSINPKIGITYQETLRHIVRQDPDVIVLAELAIMLEDSFSLS
jgi:Flp pilus assembly CpaF family ATPase